MAELIAELEALERLPARQEAAALRALRGDMKQQAVLVLSTEADVRELVKAALIACGFHQHKRQWRKRMQQEISTTPQQPAAIAPRSDDGWPALQAALAITATPTGKGGKLTKGDEEAGVQQRALAVRQVLRDHPELWNRVRRMLTSAEKTLIERVAPEGAAREMLAATLQGIRRELGYQDAPMLEKLLIEQIAVAWLDWDVVQQLYTTNAISNHTLTSGAYWDKRVTGAQARYLRAVEALARVRRLAMPQPLQVNIGGQHVNVAGHCLGQEHRQ